MRFERLFERAFTMIELMIVVSILGILASVAIPSFLTYVARSNLGEALLNTDAMARAEMGYVQRPRIDPANGQELYRCWQTSIDYHPIRNGGDLNQSKHAWDSDAIPAAFNIIGFAPSGPVRFTYTLTHDIGTIGGIDGDGYCLDNAVSTGFESLSNQSMYVKSYADQDNDDDEARLARTLNSVSGVPSAGPLVEVPGFEGKELE